MTARACLDSDFSTLSIRYRIGFGLKNPNRPRPGDIVTMIGSARCARDPVTFARADQLDAHADHINSVELCLSHIAKSRNFKNNKNKTASPGPIISNVTCGQVTKAGARRGTERLGRDQKKR